jgi:PH domain
MTTATKDEMNAFPMNPGSGLSAKPLIEASPQHHSTVLKLHVPLLYSILPDLVKRLILSWSFLSFLAPSWKKRYLILCGSYLYKFSNQGASRPKGSLFTVETTNAEMAGNQSFPEICKLPPGYTGMFCVSTLRRKHFYAVLDRDEAMIWVRSISEARQSSITRNMGHSQHMPYPKEWAHFDSLGKDLVKSSERIQERMEASRIREVEMSSITGGSIPSGFYG